MPVAPWPALDSSLFRDLYTRLVLQVGCEATRILAVTSALDGEGKTTVALNLSIELTTQAMLWEPVLDPRDVLLVECGGGESCVTQQYAATVSGGLVQYLRNGGSVDDAPKPTSIPGLWVMPLGGDRESLSLLIRSGHSRERLRRLTERFAHVVLDLPSVLVTADAQALAEVADLVILVVRAGVTLSRHVARALQELDREKLAGIVLNDERPVLPGWVEDRL